MVAPVQGCGEVFTSRGGLLAALTIQTVLTVMTRSAFAPIPGPGC